MPRPIDNLESAFTEMYEFITDLPSGLDGFESDFDEAFKELENLKVAIAQPGKPLTLEQLREMDGQPVWIVEYPDWGHWELSEDANDYIVDRNLNFYGMKHDDPDGRYGLHKLGWLAYSYPPAQQRWIPVSERLPEKGKTVLVYRKSEYVGVEESCMDRLEEIGKCTLWIGTSGWFEVTHWMPLPKPPEEG